jgi:hypothetical protein
MAEKKGKALKELPLVELGFDENEEYGMGITAMSLVSDPAIKANFVAFSAKEKPEVKWKVEDEEKRIVMGPALIPNLPIYRRNEERGEYYQYMSKSTIEKLAYSYIKQGRQANSTLEHEVKLENVVMVETWIVKDPKKDKSYAYGMEYPQGTWMIAMKVNDDEVWNDFVKTGLVKGFSIEAMLGEVMKPEEQQAFSRRLDFQIETLVKIAKYQHERAQKSKK